MVTSYIFSSNPDYLTVIGKKQVLCNVIRKTFFFKLLPEKIVCNANGLQEFLTTLPPHKSDPNILFSSPRQNPRAALETPL